MPLYTAYFQENNMQNKISIEGMPFLKLVQLWFEYLINHLDYKLTADNGPKMCCQTSLSLNRGQDKTCS